MASRFLTDLQLLAECRVEMLRTSGPGGQKRNKTASGIRITHQPTGISALAPESRKSSENRVRALRRLRLKLAVEIRESADIFGFVLPDWFITLRPAGRLAVSHRHPFYPATIGLVLDLMVPTSGNPTTVAALLGVSTTSIVKLLDAEPSAWTAANAIRAHNGVEPLTRRR